LIVIQLNFFIHNFHTIYSQNYKNNNNNVYSKISKSDDLNITMQFEPMAPIAYKQTKILFQINHLNGSSYLSNLSAVITILDTQGGLYKFGKQEVQNGKTSIDYIFPGNVSSKLIIQLYKNNQGYALDYFDVKTPYPSSTFSGNNSLNNFFSDLSKSISDFFKNFFK
ncbi:MAG: hypothetical protein ACTHJ7_10975, partial [Candidatus Nitrosocosmicus sp.]